MQIGRLAKQAGVAVQTVRFYERRGLLPDPQRKESGYRLYGDHDLRRLRFIRQAKSLGFSLDEIKEFLRMRERGLCPCTDVIKVGERHLRDVEAQIARLASFREELRRAVRKWKQCGQQKIEAGAFCALIERTMKSGS
jgi:DNA-binding transcriptional MerR regulator